MNHRAKAEAMYAAIREHYYVPAVHLYRSHYPQQPGPQKYSDLWAFSSVLSGVVALAGANGEQDYRPLLRDCLVGLEKYWEAPGYHSYALIDGSGDRYYDDNQWIAMELVQAAAILNDKSLLTRAQQVFDFILSGWSNDMGGGIYWRENDRSTKNTCSNGPAAVLALMLRKVTGETRYLDWAVKILNWVNSKLVAPQGVYYDHINRAGVIDRRTFTYNTGVMLHANVLLYEITGEARYLEAARGTAESSLRYFGGNKVGASTDRVRVFPHDPWFNAVLFRAYLALADAGEESYAQELLASLDYGWDHVRDRDGLLIPDWSGQTAPEDPNRPLLDQGPVVEMYALAASRLDAVPVVGPDKPGSDLASTASSGAAIQPISLQTGTQAALSPLGTQGVWQRSPRSYTCVSREYGTCYVLDELADYYQRMGGPGGVLGFPVQASHVATRSRRGTEGLCQRFEGSQNFPPDVIAALGNVRCGASLYWSAAYGGHVVWFEIGAAYERAGGTGGLLGFPASDRMPTKGVDEQAGYVQRFEGPRDYPATVLDKLGGRCGATIYWSLRGGAHATWGDIGAAYESAGGPTAWLGYPTSDVLPDVSVLGLVDGIRQQFEHGWIAWREKSGIEIG
jgi:hypothetical protein